MILSQRWSKRINEDRRYKICRLYESLTLLKRKISSDSIKVIDRLLDVSVVADKTHPSDEVRMLTTQKISELTKLVHAEDWHSTNFLKQAIEWAHNCEAEAFQT